MPDKMQWHALLNARRLGDRPVKTEAGRSPFQSDYDKIIFSAAFRRLARKTQVHPLVSHDMVHNRLTHSLEVACVGRTLAMRIGEQLQLADKLPDNITAADLGAIVQTTCLAHDIGNPPFGHSGEEVIRQWFSTIGSQYLADLPLPQRCDFTSFDGNAQGMRILTMGEHEEGHNGMHLTYASLAAFMKYPWTSSFAKNNRSANKFGYFTSEASYIQEIASQTGLLSVMGAEAGQGFCRHPLSFVMEAADDFCYALIDLEDGLYMGILDWQDIYPLIEPLLREADKSSMQKTLSGLSVNQRPLFVRGQVMESYISAAVIAFMDNEQQILAGRNHQDLISLCDDRVSLSIEKAKQLARQRIFEHPKKLEVEIGAYDVIATLLQQLVPALYEYTQHGEFQRQSLGKLQLQLLDAVLAEVPIVHQHDLYSLLMSAVDYISGMTDNYAISLSQQLSAESVSLAGLAVDV